MQHGCQPDQARLRLGYEIVVRDHVDARKRGRYQVAVSVVHRSAQGRKRHARENLLRSVRRVVDRVDALYLHEPGGQAAEREGSDRDHHTEASSHPHRLSRCPRPARLTGGYRRCRRTVRCRAGPNPMARGSGASHGALTRARSRLLALSDGPARRGRAGRPARAGPRPPAGRCQLAHPARVTAVDGPPARDLVAVSALRLAIALTVELSFPCLDDDPAADFDACAPACSTEGPGFTGDR